MWSSRHSKNLQFIEYSWLARTKFGVVKILDDIGLNVSIITGWTIGKGGFCERKHCVVRNSTENI